MAHSRIGVAEMQAAVARYDGQVTRCRPSAARGHEEPPVDYERLRLPRDED
jgi:hypothetical protein